MLKRIFTSNTRIKLLTVFILNEKEEFYIRELTRMLDEQINSVRRELDNLKKAGFLRSKIKNRKKYYNLNKDFILYEEIKGIILKLNTDKDKIAKDIMKTGDIKLLILSGQFVDKGTDSVDMLIVGEIDKEKMSEYLSNDLRTQRSVKYAIISEEDYRYRINCKDRFITELLSDPDNSIPINNF
ncbi:hypothetical protein GF354_04920 [Candidatus Peregrinibacteria bacterium]|nr:hypothetical protein [Candidatus Peregrinibacteria bacterium]